MNNNNNINKLNYAALKLLRNQRFEEAKAAFVRICSISPENADAWYRLGSIYGMLGDIEQADHCCRKAVTLQPDNAEAHAILGNVLIYSGKHDEAIFHYQTALHLNPSNALAHNNLGNTLKRVGRISEAISSYQHALNINPEYAVGHFNLGIALKETGHLKESGDHFRHAVVLNPNYAEAYNNLGLVLKIQNRLDEAIDAFQQALASSPNYVNAYNNLATIYYEQGYIELAIEQYRHAIALDPEDATSLNNLGLALRKVGQIAIAEEMLQRALRLRPDYAEAYNSLGELRNYQGRPQDALGLFRKAQEFALDERTAVAADTNLLMTMHYLPHYSIKDFQTAARAWNSRHTFGVKRLSLTASPADPNRRLRIGYVSGDFCSHPVGYFMDLVLPHHNKAHYEIFCYYNKNKRDELTSRLRQNSDHWRDIHGQSDEAVADLIRQDKIDILIDLSGHTQGHRLLVFARKPAPIQVTWLGYFDTTGLTTMDYIIADHFVIKADEEHHYIERVEYLPDSYLCFAPPRFPISVAAPPALSTGVVTFGCFNNPAKLTPEVVGCWSRLLCALPGTQLCLKYAPFTDIDVQKRYLKLFAENGVDGERINFSGHTSRKHYLTEYQKIDIALDPFPYNGGTTTLEALWMGVPVVTLRGEHFVGRLGESILKNIGLGECVTNSENAYIAQAITLASDLPLLEKLRKGLRGRLLSSAVCDGPQFTHDLEVTYRRMWTTWCHTKIAPQD